MQKMSVEQMAANKALSRQTSGSSLQQSYQMSLTQTTQATAANKSGALPVSRSPPALP